jgi:murein DD-endopeptidase MepM/ murein hydrolase activator NlpD
MNIGPTRVLKCPWQVPIVIGETGIDMYVKDGSVSKHARGWHSRKSPEQYAAELADYVGRMSNDSRFAGCAVFAADFASQEWFSFDIEPAYQAILATPIVDPPKPEQPPKPENPPKPEPPIGETPPVFPVGNAPLWPVRGPVTQRWGERPEFYQKALNIPCHNGVDIGIAIGSPIIAPADGVVKWVDNDPAGYGLYLRVFLPAFRVHVFLAHLDKCLVQAGDVVKRGQVIAHSGNSGMSDGPHCHIEMRLGTEHSYAAGTFGHGNGRVDPQAVFWLLGGVQEPMAGPSQ